MTEEQVQVIQALRQEGYAVVVWSLEELRGVRPSSVEDAMIERGSDVIELLGAPEDDEDE